jgi:hypothetical protein
VRTARPRNVGDYSVEDVCLLKSCPKEAWLSIALVLRGRPADFSIRRPRRPLDATAGGPTTIANLRTVGSVSSVSCRLAPTIP